MSREMTELETRPQEAEDDEISLLDLLAVVAENLRLLVLAPIAAGLVALGVSFLITPTFTAKTVFLPPQQQQSAAASMLQSLGALGGVAGAAAGLKNPADQYVALLKSSSVRNALIERFELQQRYEAKLAEDARKALDGRVRVTGGAKDGLITLEADDQDPTFAADLANAHVEELQKLLGRLAVTEAQQRRAFFEKQLTKTRDDLTRAERALKATGVDPGVLKSNPGTALEGVARLRAAITAQEIKLANLRGYLKEEAPEFRQAMNELATLRAQLARAAQEEAPSGGKGDYVEKFREFKYQETLFELFARQFELAKVDEAREGAVIQVVDTAQPPERKSKPKKALIAVVTTLAVGFLLLLLIFVRAAMRNAYQDPVASEKLKDIQSSVRRALGRG